MVCNQNFNGKKIETIKFLFVAVKVVLAYVEKDPIIVKEEF